MTDFVVAGKAKTRNCTPNNIFKSFTAEFRVDPRRQVGDLRSVSLDYSEAQQDPEARHLTELIRSKVKEYGRVFSMAKLFQKPMLTYSDGLALLLPLDNEVGMDYLTYRHPLYKKVMLEISSDIMKNKKNDDEENAARIMLTDYSTAIQYASIIRKDGRQKVDGSIWSLDRVALFSRHLERFLFQNVEWAMKHLEEITPPRNKTKGLGFNTTTPDGRPFLSDIYYAPESLYYFDGKFDRRNAWLRKNTYPLKKEWLESGALMRNFKFFLEYRNRYGDDQVFLQAFQRQAASIHTEAYRGNNADPCLNEWRDSGWDLSGPGLYKKNRIAAWEKSPGVFASCLIDDKKHSEALRRLNPDQWGTVNKRRPIFPGPNCSFSLPFVVLFRMLLTRAEESSIGFPSNRQIVLERYKRFDMRHSGEAKAIISFDRTNSEQFITDNFDTVLQFFRPNLRATLKSFCTSVIPSKFGPRVVIGLISGSAATTFLNCVVGLFEMCNLLAQLVEEEVSYEKVLERVFSCLNLGEDELVLGSFSFTLNLGTDDQVVKLASRRFRDHDDLKAFLEKKLAGFGDKRSLGVDVSDSATVFGLDFSLDDVAVAVSSGLSKWNLLEKERNGDACALKMFARLSLLTPYYELIERRFVDNHLGHLNTYEVGARNYFKQLGKFAFEGFSNMFNEFSPKDRLVVGTTLQSYGIDPSSFVDRYTVSEIEPFVNLWFSEILHKDHLANVSR